MATMATQQEESFGDELVRLIVKSPSENFKDEYVPVHRRHCTKHSPVLARFFGVVGKKDFKILDSTPSAVRLLVNWLYMSELNLEVHQGKACLVGQKAFDVRQPTQAEAFEKSKACKGEIDTFVNAWILAGELRIFKLQNNAMVKLMFVAKTCPAMFAPFYTRIYAKTQHGSPLREFVVRLAAWSEDYHEFESRPHLFPHAMLLDLIRVFSQATPFNVAAARRHQLQREYMEFIVREDQVDPDAGKEIGLADMLKKVPNPQLSLDAVGWGFPEPVRAKLNELPMKAWKGPDVSKPSSTKQPSTEARPTQSPPPPPTRPPIITLDPIYRRAGRRDIAAELRASHYDPKEHQPKLWSVLDEEAFKAELEQGAVVAETTKPVWEDSDSDNVAPVARKTSDTTRTPSPKVDWDSGESWVKFSGAMNNTSKGNNGEGSMPGLPGAEGDSKKISARSLSVSTVSSASSPKWDTTQDAAWIKGDTSVFRKLPPKVPNTKVKEEKVEDLIDLLGLSDGQEAEQVEEVVSEAQQAVTAPCDCMLVCICGRG